MHNLLSAVVRREFLKNVGKWQSRVPEPKAMLMSFSTPCDYKVEEGYRYLDLLLFATHNYVEVWTRERWNVVAIEDLEDEEDGGLKPGKDYVEGGTEWKMLASHDSCWTEAVERTFREKHLLTFSGPSEDWYKIVKPSDVNLPTK